MIEIRIHGRGGQGSVTLAELIATAVFYDGKFSQAFPYFGVERRGAPVEAYVRIDNQFICLRSQIDSPDYIIIQDDSLVDAVDVFSGAGKKTTVLINSNKPASDFKVPAQVKLITIPATAIAVKIIGKPIINTTLLGALASLSGQMTLQSAKRAIKEMFDDEGVVTKNILAISAGYQKVV